MRKSRRKSCKNKRKSHRRHFKSRRRRSSLSRGGAEIKLSDQEINWLLQDYLENEKFSENLSSIREKLQNLRWNNAYEFLITKNQNKNDILYEKAKDLLAQYSKSFITLDDIS